jgi:hypothetical protein
MSYKIGASLLSKGKKKTRNQNWAQFSVAINKSQVGIQCFFTGSLVVSAYGWLL